MRRVRWAISVFFLAVAACYAADVAPKAPPQELLDLLTKVEQDRIDVAAADVAIEVAKQATDAAVAKKAAASAAMAKDQAAFLALWVKLYGPVNPTPTPTPDPTPIPDPTPEPTPTPTKVRVLFLYDADSLASMPESQRKMLSGGLRDWLAANCIQYDGLPEWRCWDTSLPCAEPRWQPLSDAGDGQPGIVIQAGDGGKITRVDLPGDTKAAITELDKVANPKTKRLIIGESNWRAQLNTGHGRGYIRGPPMAGMQAFSSQFPLIPRSQWKQLVADGKGTFIGDLLRANKIPCKDQDGTNYCWAYASVGCVEALRALQGQPYVDLSAESVAGPIKNWRNQGGWGYEALEQLTNVGACRSDFMDSPNSLSPRRWKTGWEADRANHKIVAAWATLDDGGFDAVFTAALLRLPVSIGLDWWSHQVMVTAPVVFSDGSYGVEIRNSWGSEYGDDGFAELTESRATPSGSFAAVSVLTTDKSYDTASLVRRRAAEVKRLIDKPKACATGNCPYSQAN